MEENIRALTERIELQNTELSRHSAIVQQLYGFIMQKCNEVEGKILPASESIKSMPEALRIMQQELHALSERYNASEKADGDIAINPEYIEVLAKQVTSNCKELDGLWGVTQSLKDRLEFIRKELFFEFKYQRSPSAKDFWELDQRVEFLNSNWRERRANLFIGRDFTHPYLAKVDAIAISPVPLNFVREASRVDIVASVTDLPFKEKFSEIYVADLVSAFPHEYVKRVLIPSWIDRLSADGTLIVELHDVEGELLNAESSPDQALPYIFGNDEAPLNRKLSFFSSKEMGELLREASLTNIKTESVTLPSGKVKNNYYTVSGGRA